jgi:hypothetical protein
LVRDIDEALQLLKRHQPYHESDHVLSIAYNILAGGSRIEHLELRRNDEVFLDALGAERIPDPTTAGDFCRRFGLGDILDLLDAINRARLRVWKQQAAAFFDEAVIDADGTLVPTDAQCKQLVVSLANTQEPLFLANRGGNRPSHEMAACFLDRAATLCRRAGFRAILFRGDTDFTQTKHLDRWDDDHTRFLFGIDARANLIARAEQLPDSAYGFLERPQPPIATAPRQRPERHKERIVRDRVFETIHTLEEQVAEFAYRPVACDRDYRVIVLRKKLATDKGQMRLFEEYRYFFFITNDRRLSAEELVLLANRRCDQENLIASSRAGCTR